jgi:hypothetical protein
MIDFVNNIERAYWWYDDWPDLGKSPNPGREAMLLAG